MGEIEICIYIAQYIYIYISYIYIYIYIFFFFFFFFFPSVSMFITAYWPNLWMDFSLYLSLL